ncbi:LLM class flavin-dependent oxidoreductase [Pseudofrankia asymbiotica]|uniref:LLM class flavin-dependent oxidoreductase n=1 Tax=Pseudofrankia asymbiotica TaxID=1834516 RepID=UPI0009D645F5|nr:LLM class flavin-dependent oxidoreductase [Pseudofrankia asymbiotica]
MSQVPTHGEESTESTGPAAPTEPAEAKPVLSLGLPPNARVVEYARLAERLGYHRLWLFDSPALYGDLWMALGRVAEATERIGLGTGVAVPSLRHPMVTAAAIGTVEELAPGRLTCAFGTGFTARVALGRPAMKWADLARYVRQVRALLAGEVTEIDGAPAQMLHPPGWGPSRPLTTPLWAAPMGPRGFATARDLDVDGVIFPGIPDVPLTEWKSRALLAHGTILRPGEDHTSARLVEAVGPWFATSFHGAWELYPHVLDSLPGGLEWRAAMEASRPVAERHLAVHEGHVVTLTQADSAGIAAAGPAILGTGWTGDAASIRARTREAGAAGVTEVVYTPSGPDILAEIEAFAAAVRT